MRKFTSYLLTVVILLLGIAVSNSLAGDKYYTGTTTHKESFTQVWYQWVSPANTDSTGSAHSPAFFIGDCNDEDEYCEALANAAADFNILYHFSMDGVTWTAVTPADFDALSNTSVQDTLGIEVGTNELNFHLARWMIIECYGQAGTNPTDYITYNMTLTKDLDLQHNAQPVWVGSVKKRRTGSFVNP